MHKLKRIWRGILEQARSDGKIDEEGNIDSTSVKYTLPWIEATYRILVIHFQNAITVDDLKNLDADEIAEIRIFLEAAQMKVQAETGEETGLDGAEGSLGPEEQWEDLVNKMVLVSRVFSTDIKTCMEIPLDQIQVFLSRIESVQAFESLNNVRDMQLGFGLMEKRDSSTTINQLKEAQKTLFVGSDLVEKKRLRHMQTLAAIGLPIDHLMPATMSF